MPVPPKSDDEVVAEVVDPILKKLAEAAVGIAKEFAEYPNPGGVNLWTTVPNKTIDTYNIGSTGTELIKRIVTWWNDSRKKK